MTKQRKTELKLGNLYVIDYNDHFEAARVNSEDASMLQPVVIRSMGRLIAITPLQYNLEYSNQLTSGPGTYTHSIHGIMRSCVIQTVDLGPFPTETK